MRKNNSKTVKEPSKLVDKAKRKSSSTPLASLANGSPMHSEKSADRKKSRKNSTNDPRWADPRFQEMLEKVVEQKNQKEFAAAVKSLQALLRSFPNSPNAHWLMGAILCYELNKPRPAIPHFKKAIELNPRSERSSLGLFHCLWGIGKMDVALAEVERFQTLTNWSCQDYLEMMEEIRTKWLDGQRPAKKHASLN